MGGTFLDDEGEQPTAAELNAARQAHLAREHRLPRDKDMSYEEIDRFVKVRAAVQPWQMSPNILPRPNVKPCGIEACALLVLPHVMVCPSFLTRKGDAAMHHVHMGSSYVAYHCPFEPRKSAEALWPWLVSPHLEDFHQRHCGGTGLDRGEEEGESCLCHVSAIVSIRA